VPLVWPVWVEDDWLISAQPRHRASTKAFRRGS
jgi:hypothetical protein